MQPESQSRASAAPAAPPAGVIVLGIDPGTRVVGWGAVRVGPRGATFIAAGIVRADERLELPQRLGLIRAGLDRILSEFHPHSVAIEEAFANRNVQSALRIGEGRGVALSCAVAAGALVFQYPPAVAKKALVGHGGAHKTQVAAMVARLLGLEHPPEPLDATDALALALTHVLRATARVHA